MFVKMEEDYSSVPSVGSTVAPSSEGTSVGSRNATENVSITPLMLLRMSMGFTSSIIMDMYFAMYTGTSDA